MCPFRRYPMLQTLLRPFRKFQQKTLALVIAAVAEVAHPGPAARRAAAVPAGREEEETLDRHRLDQVARQPAHAPRVCGGAAEMDAVSHSPLPGQDDPPGRGGPSVMDGREPCRGPKGSLRVPAV